MISPTDNHVLIYNNETTGNRNVNPEKKLIQRCREILRKAFSSLFVDMRERNDKVIAAQTLHFYHKKYSLWCYFLYINWCISFDILRDYRFLRKKQENSCFFLEDSHCIIIVYGIFRPLIFLFNCWGQKTSQAWWLYRTIAVWVLGYDRQWFMTLSFFEDGREFLWSMVVFFLIFIQWVRPEEESVVGEE